MQHFPCLRVVEGLRSQDFVPAGMRWQQNPQAQNGWVNAQIEPPPSCAIVRRKSSVWGRQAKTEEKIATPGGQPANVEWSSPRDPFNRHAHSSFTAAKSARERLTGHLKSLSRPATRRFGMQASIGAAADEFPRGGSSSTKVVSAIKQACSRS